MPIGCGFPSIRLLILQSQYASCVAKTLGIKDYVLWFDG